MPPRSLRASKKQKLTPNLKPKRKPKPKAHVEVLTVTIENRLKDVLAAKSVSQASCAQRIALSRRQFTRLVAGTAAPKLDLAYLLEEVLDTPIHELFPKTMSTRLARP